MTSTPLFGVALGHSARRFDETIETARIAEDLGGDLVTLADHPHVPGELETWTMLTVLAARTQRIAIAPNVLNLGLRPVALQAKAASTLQLASGGRLILGVGAGDAEGTPAFGGPDRSPRDMVDAFGEALPLLRRLWEPGPALDHHGQYYRLSGAQVSPKPNPAIPLWVGSFGPRMLALTGQYADGWLPTNYYLELADVPDMQARIDKAAADAGRDPAGIRRIFNVFGMITETAETENGRHLVGPVDHWVGALRDYRERLGFDSFVFWPRSDRPEQTRLFFEEVRPRLDD